MTITKSYSDLAKLEWYRITLHNAKTNPTMSDSLQQIGVSAEVLEDDSVLFSLQERIQTGTSVAGSSWSCN
ncbi:MAG: hypothetical protein PF450_09280 [Bacteroidales bacterium]|nr:hypothetical protein [Bacteroidales bacterium]